MCLYLYLDFLVHPKTQNCEWNVLYFVFAYYITLRVAKDYIVRKLEKIKSSVSSFIRTSDGYKVTAPEGFVAIDHVGKALKLVDRMEFSRANFTVAKNWA